MRSWWLPGWEVGRVFSSYVGNVERYFDDIALAVQTAGYPKCQNATDHSRCCYHAGPYGIVQGVESGL